MNPPAFGVEGESTLHFFGLMRVAFVAVVFEDWEDLGAEEIIGLSTEGQEDRNDDSKWHVAGSGMV